VKEALFNIFGADIVDARFLDVFGGTGGVGIEALSRGAAHAVFIEKNRRAQETIRANLLHTRLSDRAEIVRGDVQLTCGRAAAVSLHLHRAAAVSALVDRRAEVIDEQPDWLADDGEIIVQIHPKGIRGCRRWSTLRRHQRRTAARWCFTKLQAARKEAGGCRRCVN
jgi:16S rRNA (guanine(966)-N(2))-methyltransferase RsmD